MTYQDIKIALENAVDRIKELEYSLREAEEENETLKQQIQKMEQDKH